MPKNGCPATRLVARPFAPCRGAQRRSVCRRTAVVRAAAGGVQQADVVVVGAGVAGLNAAAKLHQAGVPVLLVEASDGVGGRVSSWGLPAGCARGMSPCGRACR